jgi:NHL repeat
MIVGSGDYRYEFVADWPRVPADIALADVVAVRHCPDTDDIFVFHRSDQPVLRFTRDGELIDAWGGEYFTNRRGPHGMFLEGGGTMLLVDQWRHCVERYTYDGQRLATIPTGPPATGPDAPPAFNRPTCVVVHPNGSLYITDGYGNSYLHRFDSAGEWQHTWGRPGAEPMEFAIPHGIALDPDDNLLVADRENHRIQLIDPDGNYLREIDGLFRPCAIHVLDDGTMFVPELGADTATSLADRPIASRVSVLRADGSVAARWGEHDGQPAGNFVAAHDLCLDGEGSVYVAEVTHTMGVERGLVPPGTHALQKFAKL